MCKLLRMSLLCFLFLFTFCISCSFASINYTNFTRFNYSGSTSDLTSYIMQNIWSIDIDTFQTNLNTNNNNPTNFQSFLSDINSYSSIVWYVQTSSQAVNGKNILVHLSNNEFTGTTYGYRLSYSKTSYKTSCAVQTTLNNLSVDGTTSSSQYTDKFLYNNNYYYGNNINIDKPISKISFTSFTNDTIQVNYNGGNLTALKLFINSTIQTTKLGNLSNLDIISGTNQIKATLGYPIDSTGSLYNWADYISYYSPYFDSTYTKGSLYINYNGEVTINANYLVPNQSYVLRFDIVDSNGNTISSDILDSSTQSIEFYTLPYGSTDTSGDLISPDLDINTIPNQSLINAIDLLNQQDKQNLPYMLNGIFSGDPFSGDFMGINNDIDIDNQYTGLIYSIFNNLMDLLQNNSTDSSVTINVHGYTRTLYASDFTIGNNFFTTFCRLFLIAGTLILLYQQIVGINIAVYTLDLNTVLKSTDVDYTFFM